MACGPTSRLVSERLTCDTRSQSAWPQGRAEAQSGTVCALAPALPGQEGWQLALGFFGAPCLAPRLRGHLAHVPLSPSRQHRGAAAGRPPGQHPGVHPPHAGEPAERPPVCLACGGRRWTFLMQCSFLKPWVLTTVPASLPRPRPDPEGMGLRGEHCPAGSDQGGQAVRRPACTSGPRTRAERTGGGWPGPHADPFAVALGLWGNSGWAGSPATRVTHVCVCAPCVPQLFHTDTAGCMEVIRERKARPPPLPPAGAQVRSGGAGRAPRLVFPLIPSAVLGVDGVGPARKKGMPALSRDKGVWGPVGLGSGKAWSPEDSPPSGGETPHAGRQLPASHTHHPAELLAWCRWPSPRGPSGKGCPEPGHHWRRPQVVQGQLWPWCPDQATDPCALLSHSQALPLLQPSPAT